MLAPAFPTRRRKAALGESATRQRSNHFGGDVVKSQAIRQEVDHVIFQATGPPTLDVAQCNQTDTSCTFDSADVGERRVVQGDIVAYTYSEFKDFFGDAVADEKWNKAAPMKVEFQLPEDVLVPDVAPCIQTDSEHEVEEDVKDEERRVAKGDKIAYTYSEFKDFFGDAAAVEKWNEVAPANDESQMPEDIIALASAPTTRRETPTGKPAATQTRKGLWGIVKRRLRSANEGTETATPEAKKGAPPSRLNSFPGWPVNHAKLAKPGREHWVDGSSVAACALCKTGFHTFQRRYNCRLCGEVCCHECCDDYIMIHREHYDAGVEKAKRVCGKCFFLVNLKTSKLS
jgi:hypothetical protein